MIRPLRSLSSIIEVAFGFRSRFNMRAFGAALDATYATAANRRAARRPLVVVTNGLLKGTLSTGKYNSVSTGRRCMSTESLIADDIDGAVDFESLKISEKTKKAIAENLTYKTMTEVQRKAIPVVLAGHDVMVKSHAGTGKTLAFLVPTVDLLVVQREKFKKAQKYSAQIQQPMVLVLSPTRELAIQIAEEAKKLCAPHNFHVLTLLGGITISSEKRIMASRKATLVYSTEDDDMTTVRLDFVVATPGRMMHHLAETQGFAEVCKGVRIVVLDEADALLNGTFRSEVDTIISCLLAPHLRQTLLFSATYSSAIKEVAASFLREGYSLVDAVGEEQEQTHASVKQEVVTVPVQLQQRYLIDVLERQLSQPTPSKTVVYFTTTRHTQFMSAFARSAGIDVFELHARKTQSARHRISEAFRAAKNGIMFSSDVSARGMDYPDVSLVVQVGMTSHEQYIHRLGRTARAGKEGKGLLICAPFETEHLLKDLEGLPIVPGEEVNLAYLKAQSPSGKYEKALQAVWAAERGPHIHVYKSITDMAEESFAGWLAFYSRQRTRLGWSTDGLMKAAGEFASSLGLQQIPAVSLSTLEKTGLFNVPGLVAKREQHINRSRRGGMKKTWGRGGPKRGRGGFQGGRGGGGRDGDNRRGPRRNQQQQRY